MQSIVATLIVAVCAVYATGALMPAAWRQRLARRLLRLPVLARSGALQRAARQPGGCTSGCAQCPGAAPPNIDPNQPQPIRFVRRSAKT